MEQYKKKFIEYAGEYQKELVWDEPAPIFRKHFRVEKKVTSAVISVCALGIGVLYLNGKRITEDLFISPVSNYEKTLWYTEYDVSSLLQEGENVLAVMLGSGYYNESIHTDWCFNEAPWRAAEKLLLVLNLNCENGDEQIFTDESWLCEKDCSPTRFHQLRFGEFYDASFATDWMMPEFDDSAWRHAVFSKDLSKGILRKCMSPPIREDKVSSCKNLFQNNNGDWVFDFGQNMSGYVRFQLNQPKGTILRIVYAEQINEDGTRRENDICRPYADGQTQVSKIVCNGEVFSWKPFFSYYGFRYIIVSGFATAPTEDTAEAIFVHQAVKRLGNFRCSDEILNKIYDFSIISSLSNMFYMLTDCPTREKLGWCNDAQASAEQMVQNFDMELFFEKWLQDMWDSQDDAGDMPAIIPTAGWGFHWGNGPTSDGVMFQVLACLYQYYGNETLLVKSLPYMMKYLDFVSAKIEPETGLPSYGLDDWASPNYFHNDRKTPLDYVTTLLMVRCYRITILAANLAGNADVAQKCIEAEQNLITQFKKVYINSDGTCKLQEQTALSMMLALGIGENLEGLKQQYAETLREKDYHISTGMVGMQFILPACDVVGLQEDGYKILTAKGYPSYHTWFENDATSLYEKWEDDESRNHHMYSCPIAWFHNSILGIKQDIALKKKKTLRISPYFLKELQFAEGSYQTICGEIGVAWKREGHTVFLEVTLPDGVVAEVSAEGYAFKDSSDTVKPAVSGKNSFVFVKQ